MYFVLIIVKKNPAKTWLTMLAPYVSGRIERKETKEKEKENQHREKVTFVWLEPTPSVMRVDVLSQLD